MHLFLHAGQHKTGSSAIQLVLRDAVARLGELGVFVPVRGMNGMGSHRPLIVALAKSGGVPDEAMQEEWEAAARAGFGRALVSAEYVKKLVVEGGGGAILEGFRRLGASRISLVLYLRNPFELANSSYSQRTGALVNGGVTFRQHVGALLRDAYYEYGRILEVAAPPDVELTVLPYDAASRRGVNRHFFGALGLPTDWLPEQEARVNAAHGPMAVEAMRRMALELETIPAGARNGLRAAFAGVAERYPEPAPFWGVDDAARAALAPADARTDAFARAVWGRPWRERLPDEERPLNAYRADTAAREDRVIFGRMIRDMRACRGEGG